MLRAALIAALVTQSAALVAQQMQIDDLQTQHIEPGLAGDGSAGLASGPPGPTGPPGPPGLEGKAGRDGKDGQDGRDGRDGVSGANGKEGKDGKDGTNGQNAVATPKPTESSGQGKHAVRRALPGNSSVTPEKMFDHCMTERDYPQLQTATPDEPQRRRECQPDQ